MLDSTSLIFRLTLRCDRWAARVVRRALDEAAGIAPVLDDARTVATELVNNAVLHSGCDEGGIIRVIAHLDGDFLTISVHDPGIGDRSPRVRAAGDPAPGGLGLKVVQELSHRWGADRPDGRRVWAELAVGAA